VIILAGTSSGQVSLPERQLKAAFLYNFAKFVEWPGDAFAGPADPLRFCVLGDDLVGEELDRLLRGKTIANRPLVARRLKGVAEAQHCHVLFIAAEEQGRMRELPGAVRGASVLTVGENNTFIAWGGVINLLLEDEQLRFEVSLRAAGEARLKISSKLLALARAVHTGGGG